MQISEEKWLQMHIQIKGDFGILTSEMFENTLFELQSPMFMILLVPSICTYGTPVAGYEGSP